MKVVVFSAGRSGTNIALEVLRGNPYFLASDPPEDKAVFLRDMAYPDRYLTKSDATYCRSYSFLKNVMEQNRDMFIVWTVRDPRDMCLSKIRRGFKRGSDDATFDGCIADLFHMVDLHKRAMNDFKDRIYTIKMENILLDTEPEIKNLCRWLNIEYLEEMKFFYKRMRNKNKKKRYSDIDLSQIKMYRNQIYTSEVADYGINLVLLFLTIKPIINYFGYGV
uniref:Putative sulfotransferase domain contining protein n=1 Tax=viral metagenome TaxID=1070528 RepID=A0A6H1ZLI8_9ZZZZ